MPRQPRSVFGGEIYHVFNRGRGRRLIFHKPADYLAFLGLMEEGRQRTGMRILAYCLMPNHFHLVLWPKRAKDLAAFVGWVSNTQVRHWREQRRSDQAGRLFEGRFKSFPAQAGKSLYELLRYVEGNPHRAKLARSAERWPYSSLFTGPRRPEHQVRLTSWPLRRPPGWIAKVNEPLPAAELTRLRLHVQRNRPYGDPAWTARAAKRMHLEWTIHPHGRPPKPRDRSQYSL